MCQSSFEGFIALFDNLVLQIRQSGQGAAESLVEINLYFKYDSLYWQLKEAFRFFDVVGPSSSTSDS